MEENKEEKKRKRRIDEFYEVKAEEEEEKKRHDEHLAELRAAREKKKAENADCDIKEEDDDSGGAKRGPYKHIRPKRKVTPERKKKKTYIEEFSPDEIADIVIMLSQGATQWDVADHFGLSQSFVRNMLSRSEDFEKLYSRAQENADMQVENALFRRCLGYNYVRKLKKEKLDRFGKVVELNEEVLINVPPDAYCLQFYLTNRMRDKWKKNPEATSDVEDGGVSVIEITDVMKTEDMPEQLVKAVEDAKPTHERPEIIYAE